MNRFLSLLILTAAVAGSTGTAHAFKDKKPPRPPHAHMVRPIDPQNVKKVESEHKATAERAEHDIHVQLAKKVSQWLTEEGVPSTWTPPQNLIDSMIVDPVSLEPIKFHGLDVFVASCHANFSPEFKHALVEKYHRQHAGRLLLTLGGILGFVLTCLATLSGYIRADEATKGYYTNQLRLVAAAGVGAAGVVIYQVLT